MTRQKPPPYLIVTDDGRRPWHQRFRVRELEDGRRVAYWLGSYEGREVLNDRLFSILERLTARGPGHFQSARNKRWYKSILPLKLVIGGVNWNSQTVDFPDAEKHLGLCNVLGFVGIAFLPDPPDCWRPDSVWPSWSHVAHGKDLQHVFDMLDSMSDEMLLSTLEASHACGGLMLEIGAQQDD